MVTSTPISQIHHFPKLVPSGWLQLKHMTVPHSCVTFLVSLVEGDSKGRGWGWVPGVCYKIPN